MHANCSEHNYLTIICNAERDPKKEIHYLRSLKDYRIGGVIFAGGGLTIPGHIEQLETTVQEMKQRGAAIVTLAQHTLHVPSIQVDNFEGAKNMTARLIAAGHQRIAFVSGPSDLLVANVRLQGYMTALVEHGYSIDPTLIFPGNFTRQGGEQAVHRIAHLDAQQRPTAIFGANDETAFGILLGIRQQGWRVPNDVEVCGFGDLPFAQLVAPALTTVHIPLRELGRTGARELL